MLRNERGLLLLLQIHPLDTWETMEVIVWLMEEVLILCNTRCSRDNVLLMLLRQVYMDAHQVVMFRLTHNSTYRKFELLVVNNVQMLNGNTNCIERPCKQNFGKPGTHPQG